MSTAPIQVILNADNYRRDRQTSRPVSNGTDFYLGDDAAFALHRERIKDQLNAVYAQLSDRQRADLYGPCGYARVSMRTQAIAKSHRPTTKLFTSTIAPVVGGEQLGEMVCLVTPDAIQVIGERVSLAEEQGKTGVDRRTGEVVPAPSRSRCEVSAIASVELWDRSRRRRFALDQAIAWLRQPGTGHGYIVDLFEPLPRRMEWDRLSAAQLKLFESFENGLTELGLRARRLDDISNSVQEVQIRMVASTAKGPSHAPPAPPTVTFVDDPEVHRSVIGFLESHPLVREVRLPTLVVQSPAATTAKAPSPSSPPVARIPGQQYPKIGVIDGGVAAHLSPWVCYESGLLDPADASLEHGTFIAGLIVEGASRNPLLGLDVDGCELSDLNIFPNTARVGAFDTYYPNGTPDFFNEVETAIAHCREQTGTRIFNLSINAIAPAQLDRYSAEARRLDEIAERHDVIIVVSAGNLTATDMRAEWPRDKVQATAILAASRDDGLFIPAETVRNISVAALNPIGMSSCIADVPARYSRRGPGLRTGVKPDLCHYGGAGTTCITTGSGLHSIAPDGTSVSGCGTSYAAPLVAKTLALLDHAIEGHVSRETLIGLAVHGALTPKLLQDKAFRTLAPQLVGFGRPQNASALLAGSPHEITLLFSSRITVGKMLEFRFVWPPSLVGNDGKCAGEVRLTLVSTPPLDYRFGSEFIRVNVDAALQQEDAEGKFRKVLEPTHVFFAGETAPNERDLIEHGLKWATTKAFAKRMNGRGMSSNWRLAINYLERAGTQMPDEGVPFSVLLTIRDPRGEKPVFQEMRQTLEATGIRTADIRTATRVSTRV